MTTLSIVFVANIMLFGLCCIGIGLASYLHTMVKEIREHDNQK